MAIRKIIKRATDALFTNPEFDGTEAARMVKGTTGERASAEAGDMRFNTTTSLMEYYDGTIWKSIDSPPTISSISPTVESDANADIVITGSNFQSGATVKFVGDDGTEYASPTVTIDSATQITATTPSTALSVANEPYDVVVTNVSGLSGTLADALDAGGVPAFNESAGSLGTFYDTQRTGISVDAGATDPDGDTITYSVSAGSLPSGLSLNTSTGEISGDADAVGSQTTSTFTISAATASDTSTRQFTITINAPVITSYTSTGSGTFSVPSGLTAVDVLVVAGGGGGGDNQGAGGAGGLIYRPAFPVTPGGSVSYTVGGGAAGATGNSSVPQIRGQNSTFGTLTAIGGGSGGSEYGPAGQSQDGSTGTGYDGGSGGGGCYPAGGPGYGIQSQEPGDSGTYGFGNNGGAGQGSNPYNTGGGGGAGAVGQQAGPGFAANGGIGKQYDISGSQVYYAGGGGGGRTVEPGPGGSGGQGGGGNGGRPGSPPGATPGVANRGGGGGSNGEAIGDGGNSGGSGIVIVSY
jgi:hypothetical protein